MVKITGLTGSHSNLYMLSPAPDYARDTDDPHTGRYIPMRPMPFLRPGRDVMVVPGDMPQLRESAEFFKDLLGYSADQVLYTSGTSYLLEHDAEAEIIEALRARVSGSDFTLVPYIATDVNRRFAELLGIPFLGETPEWMRRFGTKAILHPNAFPDRRPSYLPLLTKEVVNVPVPRGYFAMDTAELLRACDLLKDAGVTEMILKPVGGSAGEGIVKVTPQFPLESYGFRLGSVVLEEFLAIETDRDGHEIAPSIQYTGTKVGFPSDQLLRGKTHSGNRYPSCLSEGQVRDLRLMVERVVSYMDPQSIGGFDAVIVDGKLKLIDVNTARWNGVHPALFFQSAFAGGSAFVCFKVSPKCGIREYWARLQGAGIAFDPNDDTTGTFPLTFLDGMWGMLACYAKSISEAEEMAERAKALL